MLSFRKKRYKGAEIDPDEIFLDSRNLPEFDRHQFEGRLEKPISRYVIFFLGGFFVFFGFVFFWKLVLLQIKDGTIYHARAENNRLHQTPLFAERGVIFDRNGRELAWNSFFGAGDESLHSKRNYIQEEGFSHLLGYVRYPKKDKSGFYYEEQIHGEEGVERAYDTVLAGENGMKLVETNALQEVQAESVLRLPKAGENVVLSVDARVQKKLYSLLRALALEVRFNAGAGVLMDVSTGDIVAMASFPEYSSEALTLRDNAKLISAYQNDPRKPFLNRVIGGLYAPGSIVKPVVALGALREGIIDPETEILSTGSLSVPNPYVPGEFSVFDDWKAHGYVSMRDALAVSSNVYFFEVGGGYGTQKGLGIQKIAEYMREFGFGKETGVDVLGEARGLVPTPAWKEETFHDEWRIGDTYNTAIGQYGFQITPIQAVRVAGAIATNGVLLTPRVVSAIEKNESDAASVSKNVLASLGTAEELKIPREYFQVVREGMRQAVTHGTAGGLNIPFVNIAAKTGTAEVGITKKQVNSWIIGYFPYENPKIAFSVVMEKGPRENLVGALSIMRQLLEWMYTNTPEYF